MYYISLIYFIFVFYLCIRISKSCPITTDPNYVVVNSFYSLNCAILNSIKNIYINESFGFQGTIYANQTNTNIYGIDHIILTALPSSPMFIISEGSNINFSNLVLEGANVYSNVGAIASIYNSNLTATNLQLKNGISLCGGAFLVNNSRLVIDGSAFTNNSLTDSGYCQGGGSISAFFSYIYISSSEFQNNYADSGGALFALSSEVKIENTLFLNNRAIVKDGGAIHLINSSLLGFSLKLSSNFAYSSGGGISISLGSNAFLQYINCQLNSVQTSEGGCMSSSNSNLTIENSILRQNFALSGAGFSLSDTSLANFVNITFFKNSALQGAGAIKCLTNGLVAISNSTLYGNQANLAGGGFIINSCKLIMENCRFENNLIVNSNRNPTAYGGALYLINSNAVIRQSNFSNSLAAIGSAIYTFNSTLSISLSGFSNNIGLNSALYASYEANLLIQNSTFLYNIGKLKTSAVSCLNTNSCFISGCLFNNNTANDEGAIYSQYTNLKIENSKFINNFAKGNAGSVTLDSCLDSKIISCVFENNYAEIYGGAVYIKMNSKLTILDTSFYRNLAVSGGAVYALDNTILLVYNSVFDSNTAEDSGGAIYISDFSYLTSVANNFTRSFSPLGGAIYGLYKTFINITNNNFFWNSAPYSGGAVALYDYSELYVSNSKFLHCNASLGGVFSAQYHSNLNISDSEMQHNYARQSGGVIYSIIDSLTVFRNNLVHYNLAFNGGVFYLSFSAITLTGSLFKKNNAFAGNCFYSIKGVIFAEYNRFLNNSDALTIYGGVAYLSASSEYGSYNCTYENNAAIYGGTFYSVTSMIESINDTYSNCRAIEDGACIYSQQKAKCVLDSVAINNMGTANFGSVLYSKSSNLLIINTDVKNCVSIVSSPLTLISSNIVITKSRFFGNQVNQSNGGAISISSIKTKIDLVDVSIEISNSSFHSNYAINGDGGALFLSNISSTNIPMIFMNNFTKNSAKNGGAFAVFHANATFIENDLMFNNAENGGGAIYWTYFENYVLNIPKNNFHKNNTASYGDYKATNLYKLNSTIQSTQVSGQKLQSPIYVYLFDYYDQIIRSPLQSEALTVFSTVYNNSGSLSGSSIETVTNGVAVFSQVILISQPGSYMDLQFSVLSSNVQSSVLRVNFRECIPGEISNDYNGFVTCLKCTLGTFSLTPTDKKCTICPSSVYCPGGNVLDLNPNYWRVDALSSNILQCSIPNVCLGGSNVSTQCATGQTGAYCQVCQSGYSKSQMGTCYSCNQSVSLVTSVFTTVLFVLILLIALLVYKFRDSLKKSYDNILTQFMKNRKMRTLRVKAKIIVAFCQIVYQLGPALDIIFPSNFINYLNYYSIFQLNLIYIPGVDCLFKTNYYTSLLFTTISPFVLFFIIALIIQFLVFRAYRMNRRHPSYTRKSATRDTFTAAFLISYFVLVSASTKIFQVFQCEQFDNGQNLLVADYSIDCNGSDRNFYLTYGVIMILVYPIGIPLVYAIILLKNRKKINPDWRLVVDGKEKELVSNKVIQNEKIKVRQTYMEIQNIKNLYDSYVPKRWYFELFDCARRLCLGAIPVLIIRGSFLQIIIVLLISLFSVGIFMYFNPYIHTHDNKLAIMAQWSITLVLISALIIKVESISSGSAANGLGVVLIFLNLFIIGFSVSTAILNSKSSIDSEANDSQNENENGEYISDEEDENENRDTFDDNSRCTSEIQMNPLRKAANNALAQQNTKLKNIPDDSKDSDDEYDEENEV